MDGYSSLHAAEEPSWEICFISDSHVEHKTLLVANSMEIDQYSYQKSIMLYMWVWDKKEVRFPYCSVLSLFSQSFLITALNEVNNSASSDVKDFTTTVGEYVRIEL